MAMEDVKMENCTIMEPSASPASRQWDQLAAGWNANTPIIRQWLKISTDAMISVVNISNGMCVLDVAAGARKCAYYRMFSTWSEANIQIIDFKRCDGSTKSHYAHDAKCSKELPALGYQA